jgi:arginyl-tRNA synthetase
MLPGIVDLLKEKGLARESEGAMVVFFEDENLAPLIVQKKDGAFNYATTDLATIRYRVEELNADQIVYVTDERQQLHFRQVFSTAEMMGFSVPLEHVWFGLMRLPEGTFSTRQGNVIKLERLLDEAESRALALAKASADPEIPEDELREIARVVGLGAVKYADLSQNRQTLITFDWDRMLSLEGNTAPYLQYTYARIRSIWRKYQAGEGAGSGWKEEAGRASVFEDKAELDLAKGLLLFPEVVERAGRLFRPNVITDYLFELCQLYNGLYQNVTILKAAPPERARRLLLCEAVSRTIKRGLDLLGIETVERM